MKILLFASGFNGLCQRVHRELSLDGHTVSVELAVNPGAMVEAVDLFRPDLIVCPFLKQRIPDVIWKRHLCLIVHPGIEGDRGPSSLDWAILSNQPAWGVTVLQADAEMDAGDIWAAGRFPMREAGKASLYRREVTQQAVRLVRQAVKKADQKNFTPKPLDYKNPDIEGRLMPAMKQDQRRIDWRRDPAGEVIRKINTADSCPGVLDDFLEEPVYLYGARRESHLSGPAGEIIARCDGAVCRATADGAVWIRMAKRRYGPDNQCIKLPATQVLDSICRDFKKKPAVPKVDAEACRDIHWHESRGVAYLYFNFYNGAMNTEQCRRLQKAFRKLKKRSNKVIVLMGGDDFWSNGIHLNCIEAADDPAAESWRNIRAMDDLVSEIIRSPKHLTVAAVRNNAGAGGAIMPLACDIALLRDGVVLNPHYATMGLYGSEYWTYLLPRRVGESRARQIMHDCMPVLAAEAVDMGMADKLYAEDWNDYHEALFACVEDVAAGEAFSKMLAHKNKRLKTDEKHKPLEQYRKEELARMRAAFFDRQSEYHLARKRFVHKEPPAETPLRLALHRQPEQVWLPDADADLAACM